MVRTYKSVIRKPSNHLNEKTVKQYQRGIYWPCQNFNNKTLKVLNL